MRAKVESTRNRGLLQIVSQPKPWGRPMSNLLRNLRYSARTLCKNPGLTLTVLFTLALGIGANTAIFTVGYATLLAPLPYAQPDQLVVVWSKIKTFHNGLLVVAAVIACLIPTHRAASVEPMQALRAE